MHQGQGQQPNPNGPGGQGQWAQGNPNQQGNGMGQAGIGNGGQGQKQTTPYGTKSEVDAANYDKEGQHLASVYIKDRSIRGDAKLELAKIVGTAKAEEGDDIDESRADRRTQEAVRRYFKVLEDQVVPGK